eukprot:Lankesteria_metandrocarpae@DN10572_c0_g1_i1.p1
MVDTRNVQRNNITDSDDHSGTSDNTTILNTIQNMATDMNTKFQALQNHISILDTYCHATDRSISPPCRRQPRIITTTEETTPLLGHPTGTATPAFPTTATTVPLSPRICMIGSLTVVNAPPI